jgi:squalene synthase HpnC
VRHGTRHYENFTVVSFRQPRRIKQALGSIYAYCRHADDIADETGDPDRALHALDLWETSFNGALEGSHEHPILTAVAATIRDFDLPPQPFRDLLTAFRQDQTVHRYQTFDDLLGYCRNSANPVGRIVLALFGYREEKCFPASDAICTGLQLANFWQDVVRDDDIRRIYIPQEDLHSFGVAEDDIHHRKFTPAFRDLTAFEVVRTRELFERGRALVDLVGWDLRWEIEMFRRAGLSVLTSIEKIGYNVIARRPTISGMGKFRIALASLPALFRYRRHGR